MSSINMLLDFSWLKWILYFLDKTKARLLKWILIDTFLNTIRAIPVTGPPLADTLDAYLGMVAKGLDQGLSLIDVLFTNPLHWFPYTKVTNWIGFDWAWQKAGGFMNWIKSKNAEDGYFFKWFDPNLKADPAMSFG